MKNHTQIKLKAYAVQPKDRIKIGTKIYRVKSNERAYRPERTHLVLYPIGTNEPAEMVSLMLPRVSKIKVYRKM